MEHVGAQGLLDLDRQLRGQEMLGSAVQRRAESDTLLIDLAERGQAEDLVAAGVGQDRSGPRHEAVEAAERLDETVTRTQDEVVGVGEDDLGPDLGEVGGSQALVRPRGSHRHEGRSIHQAVRCPETAPPRGALAGDDFEGHARRPIDTRA